MIKVTKMYMSIKVHVQGIMVGMCTTENKGRILIAKREKLEVIRQETNVFIPNTL